jgi:hypothetical protein
VGFVSESAYLGEWTQSPFNFKNKFYKHANPPVVDQCQIKDVQLRLNGNNIDKFNEDDPQNYLDYLKLYNLLGFGNTGINNTITLQRFNGGVALYAFDLTSSLNAAAQYSAPLVRKGQTRFSVNFTEQLGETVTAIVYAEWNATVKIDFDRKIECNFLT